MLFRSEAERNLELELWVEDGELHLQHPPADEVRARVGAEDSFVLHEGVENAEGEAVARSLGIELHGDPRQLVQKGAAAPGKHRASMLQDVIARRQTEVDFMNGAIVKWGEKLGVPTPYLWSFSNMYVKGKYVADHKFDPNAVSAQCGSALMLKSLQASGLL